MLAARVLRLGEESGVGSQCGLMALMALMAAGGRWVGATRRARDDNITCVHTTTTSARTGTARPHAAPLLGRVCPEKEREGEGGRGREREGEREGVRE